MSLNARAIATLGIGFGPTLVAYLGLWPVGADVTPPPQVWGPGPISITQQDLRQGFKDDQELLEIIPIVVEVINGRR